MPDLPGCIATGETIKDIEREIREASQFQTDGMREDGLEVPKTASMVEYVEA